MFQSGLGELGAKLQGAVVMRLPVRAPGRSAGLLFCGVALQILLAVLCDAASADSPLGVAERDADKNLRDEENIDEDNDTNHGGTLPPAAGESLRARAFPTVLLFARLDNPLPVSDAPVTGAPD